MQTAKQAMRFEQTRIDTMANNLANVSTAGFKQVLTRVAEESAAKADGPVASGLSLGSGTRTSVTDNPLAMTRATDMRAGELTVTGRGTDVALSGPGFFVVQDQEGNEMYTRDGGFRLDDTGRLVTASGLSVQSTAGPVNAAGGEIVIQTDGTVTVDGAARGRLRVVEFEAPETLMHDGNGMMAAPADQAPQDVPVDDVTVMQGYIEGSNVDPVRTLVDMIAAQRAFEVESKVLQSNDEMLSKSVNTLGRTS